jgi:hypothetical protein
MRAMLTSHLRPPRITFHFKKNLSWLPDMFFACFLFTLMTEGLFLDTRTQTQNFEERIQPKI